MMKILVIGLDGMMPEILFSNHNLVNLHRLLELGCYGKFEGIIPSLPVLSWFCMSNSQDPGSLGIYGLENRVDYSYDKYIAIDARMKSLGTLWDSISCSGRHTIVSNPFIMDAAQQNKSRYPNESETSSFQPFIYPDIRNYLSQNEEIDPSQFHEKVVQSSRKSFETLSKTIQGEEWDFIQFFDPGFYLIQEIYWQYYDSNLPQYIPDNIYKEIIPGYYQFLDEQIGSILELIDDDTIVLILSIFGIVRLKGEFNLNEWLIQQGYLVLKEYPRYVKPFHELEIDWESTKVWAREGECGQIFINIKGREKNGTINKQDILLFRDELKKRLEEVSDNEGNLLESVVHKPEVIYDQINNIPPDLIVSIDGMKWRCNDKVGYRDLFHPASNNPFPNFTPTSKGFFIMASINNPLYGEVHETSILDIVPTVLDLSGNKISQKIQGHSLISSVEKNENEADLSRNEKDILRERLSGLGYIS
jgi:predicted AlkP superfamily phosphohydrolase/phosphomutase